MALKFQLVIDYLFAFGMAFFSTLLVFGVLLVSAKNFSESFVYYLAGSIVFYNLAFVFFLKLLAFAGKFEKSAVQKKQGR